MNRSSNIAFVSFCIFQILLTILTRASFGAYSGTCERKTSCDSCVSVVGCAWCKDLKEPGTKFQRCNSVQAHISNKCGDIQQADPVNKTTTRNEQISKTMRIQPQTVDLTLGAGQVETIELSYNDSTDRALDLYYIMDLSATMEEDRKTVAAQAQNMVKALKKITADVRLGFGAFIDKPVLPFVSSSQLRNDKDPSGKEYDIPYGFKNWVSLTDDITRFQKEVEQAKISRNLDEPEGTLDALMQAIICKNEIGWRDSARKLIVVATDGLFHIAGDGKLGGILRPNDMKCHMKNNIYTHSTILDYPSIGEINAVIAENQVYVIFALSTSPKHDAFKMYEELQKHIRQSTTELLEQDSKNVVEKVRKKYEEISKTVTLRVENTLNHVEIKVLAKCSAKDYLLQNYCSDVGVGSLIKFKLEVKLKECPDPKRGNRDKDKVEVTFGLSAREKLELNINYACKCKCNKITNKNPNDLTRYCSGRDASSQIACGMCSCINGRYGNNCQCSTTDDTDQGNNGDCIALNSTNQIECSGKGTCKCGICECPSDYNGKYCEDSTASCQNQYGLDPSLICSGPNGICNKGKCICDNEYDGKYCECKKSTKISCVEPGKTFSEECNKHGTCDCFGKQAQCKCDSGYDGIYCERCKINCPEDKEKLDHRCQDKSIQECVKCQVQKLNTTDCTKLCDWQGKSVSKSGSSIRDDVLGIDFEEHSSDVDGTECTVRINDTCVTTFKYKYQKAPGSESDILKVFYTSNAITCVPPPPPKAGVIIGVIASVLIAGILGLLIWKICTHIHDTREYQRFEKERSLARWQGGENPLYSKPLSEFQNPAYRE